MKSPTTPIEVFAGTPWQAGMVHSLLEDAGIRAYVRDEIMGTMNPWWVAPGGAGAVRVFVAEEDYEVAMGIVGEYERNLRD